jgi:hypothetical protein
MASAVVLIDLLPVHVVVEDVVCPVAIVAAVVCDVAGVVPLSFCVLWYGMLLPGE